MLLHRIQQKIINANRAFNNKPQKKYDNPVINNTMTIEDIYEQEQENIYVEEDNVDYENIYKDIVEVVQYQDTATKGTGTVRGINNTWKPVNLAGIYSIAFYIDSSGNAIPTYKISNVYVYFPISSSLVYVASEYMPVTADYQQGNIFAVPQKLAVDASFNFTNSVTASNYIVGQGISRPLSEQDKIYAIAMDASNNIYIGGKFVIDNGIIGGIKGFAKWDGTTWTSINNFSVYSTIEGDYAIYSIAVIDQSNIYVGGYFDTINYNDDSGQPVTYKSSSFAKWNGLTWEPILLELKDSSGLPASIYTMKWDGTNLYIGGKIYTAKTPNIANPIAVYNILKYNPLTRVFDRLGFGTDGDVYAIDIDIGNKRVYVGGSFSFVKDTSNKFIRVNCISRWDVLPKKWVKFRYSTSDGTNSINVGVTNKVYTVAINPKNKNEIWIGGEFTTTKKNPISRAGKYVASFNVLNNNTTKLWAPQRPYYGPNGV